MIQLTKNEFSRNNAICRLIETALNGCYILYRFYCEESVLSIFLNKIWGLIFEKR